MMRVMEFHMQYIYHKYMKSLREHLLKIEPRLCVISTVGKTAPESAVMAYAVGEDLTIILATHTDSRKWKNIQHDPHVSLLFGWDFEGISIQYEGVATLVLDDRETEEFYYKANPFLVQFRDQPGTAYIKVRPTWTRVTDYSFSPPKIVERKH